MSLSAAYLTPKQILIWGLKKNGLYEAKIARKLKVTRQTIHKALSIANLKVNEALEEAARINRIEIKTVDSIKGVLVGYSSHFKTKALVTFSTKNGIQVWYRHEGDCLNCDQLENCRETLIAEAKERNLPLPENEKAFLPSDFAEELFSRITGEKK
jgi:transcriptional regulator